MSALLQGLEERVEGRKGADGGEGETTLDCPVGRDFGERNGREVERGDGLREGIEECLLGVNRGGLGEGDESDRD